MRKRSYLSIYASGCAGLLLAVVAANLAIDPLHFYHRPFFNGGFVKNQPYQNPGLAKNYAYDSVIIGTSHTENFRPPHIDDVLGWQTLKLSMSGSTAREQRLVLSKALESRPVKHVLWGVDFESFAAGADVVRPGFPFHLYHERWDTPLKYLVSADTLKFSLRSIRGRGPKELAALGYWADDFTFSKERVVAAWKHSQAAAGRESHNRPGARRHADADAVLASLHANLTDIVRQNPQTRFYVFFPPYSILASLQDFTISSTLFRDRLRFQAALVRELADCDNCEIYDFQQAADVTHSLDNYKDLTHYSGRVSDFIVESIARGDYRVRSDQHPQQLAELERRVHEFARRAATPGNEYFRELGLQQTRFLGLEPPQRIAGAHAVPRR